MQNRFLYGAITAGSRGMSKKPRKGKSYSKAYKAKAREKATMAEQDSKQVTMQAEPAAPPGTDSGASSGLQQPRLVTLQQQRAAFALERVQAWAERPVDEQKKLNSYASKMPFMVHANGLGQTAAFYRAKKENDPHHLLYRLLSDWLAQQGQPFAEQGDLLNGITHTDLHTYMVAQAEAMLFLSWVKQFADAFLARE
ncbi:MAG: type III-B CRISPR module-associated protein Cmr5 [Candidatus Competibacteraceae bacterium]|nr:type III-B CRISPR module-associated protein Cmr5 [Candidatus Competibacteraceae bacterium]MCB1813246.1 type III-B CRISPR module-associated protein Cmr5 [Candidatus Competibacteraceae bacterium]